MSLKTVTWRQKCSLPCARCAPAGVILCLKQSSLLAPKLAPLVPSVDPQTTQYLDFEWITIEGTLLNVYPYATDSCGKVTAWEYVIQYEGDLVLGNYDLVGNDIKSVTCQDCSTDWVKEQVGDEIKIEDIGGGMYRLFSQHGAQFEIAAGGSGPQGAQGSQGPQGNNGSQGSTGSQGPPGSGAATPSLGCGLQYVGLNITAANSGVWGSGNLNFPGGALAGGEIYCDTNGQLRGIPPTASIIGQASFIGSGGTPPQLLLTYNNPSPSRVMRVLAIGTYQFEYHNYGGTSGGPILSYAIDGGPMLPSALALGIFTTTPIPQLSFGGSAQWTDTSVYPIAAGATLNISRTVQMVKQEVGDTVNSYSVGLRGIGVAA